MDLQGVRAAVGPMLALVVTLMAGPGRAAAVEGPLDGAAADRVAIVRVPIVSTDTIHAATNAGLRPYRQITGADGDYLLAGIVLTADGTLPDVGLSVQLLDADTRGAAYYLATVLPPQPPLAWAAFGRVLYDDGAHVLLRTTAADAERLAEAGAEVAAIPLTPMVISAPGAETGRAAATLALTPDPTVQVIIDQVSSSAVTTYEEELTGVVAPVIDGAPYTIRTRHTLSGTPIQKATRYAGAHLAARGLSVEYQTWNAATNPNVIGELTGLTTPGDIVIIGAHLDDMPGGSIAPGADDNASGSTAVLIAADVLTQYQWACTLRFALWTGEEQGLLGSAAYAQRAFTRGEAIRGYLNLDMLGYDSSGYGEITLVSRSTVPGSVAMMDLFADVVDAYGLDLAPVKLINDGLGNYSDNASFWPFGYASILGIEGRTYGFTPYYHTTSDTLATLDVAYLTEFVKASVGTFVHLSGCLLTTPTPTATATPTATPTPSPPPATPTPTPTWVVSGGLRYYAGDRPIANATVSVSGPVPMSTGTDPSGAYACDGVSPGTNTLTPEKHGDTGSAVSSLDAAYVLQTVVGMRTLDDRQTLACEISGNGALSAFDAALILQRSVGLIGAFPVETACGSEWVFVPTPVVVPNQRLVQPTPGSGTCQVGAITYEPLSASATSQDFAGIVFGDCTGNWAPAGGTGTASAASTVSARVHLGRPQRRPGRATVPVTVAAARPFHAVELELQVPRGDTVVRVRRGPAASTAMFALAATPGGRVRVALASAAGFDPARGPLLLVDVGGGRSEREPLRVVSARVDEIDASR